MKSRTRIFTLQEAEALLPELSSRIKHIIEKKEMYDRRHDEVFLHELLSEAETSGGIQEDGTGSSLDRDFVSLEEDLMDLKREVEKLSRLGCILQDVDSGCIELPGKINGRQVYFCWKYGEDRILFYREWDGPEKQRLPLHGKEAGAS